MQPSIPQIYHLIAYLCQMPAQTAQELLRNPTDPFYRQTPTFGRMESDVIPETVRRSAGRSITPTEGNYVIDRPPYNTRHRA